MSELVVLNLGQGSFSEGFPSVTARLGKPGHLGMQFTGSLPPAPEIPQLYTNWRLLYQSLYREGRRSPIEIAPTGITNISEGAFSEVSQRLEMSLNRWLSTAGFHSIESQLRTQLSPDRFVQVIVESDNDEVWRLPWHLWQFAKEDFRLAEMGLSSSNYPLPAPQRSKPPGSPVKILVILGNSAGINTKKDWRLLKQLPGVVPKLLVEPEREELNDQLWEQGWDILVFAGHSGSAENATHGRLFINQNQHHNSLTIDEIQEALSCSIERGLQLVIFNSCDGLGLVRDLAAARIPLPPTIAMREPVVDCVAQAFLKYFLREFACGELFPLAVRQARERLKGLENRFPGASWLPVICQHPGVVPFSLPQLRGSFGSVSVTEGNSLTVLNSRCTGLKGWSKFLVIFLFGCIISSYFLAGSRLAPWVNELGLENYHNGQLLKAQFYYRIAALLDLNYANPHYNLAWLCEKNLNDTNCAIQEYQRAALRGLAEAHAQLARGQIRGKFPEASLTNIWQCLELTNYDAVKAACFKNRGWIRLEQGRLNEAEDDLRQAIQLEVDSPHAYCLLAQVLEKTGRDTEALIVWENMLKYANPKYNVPELDECIGWANQRLQAGENLR